MSLETYLAEVCELVLASEADLEMSPGRGSDSAEALAHFHVPRLLLVIRQSLTNLGCCADDPCAIRTTVKWSWCRNCIVRDELDRIADGQPCQPTTDAEGV